MNDLKRIGLMINQLDGSLQSALWRGVQDAVKALGWELLVLPGRALDSPLEEESYHNAVYRLADPAKLDGLIVTAGALANYAGTGRLEQMLQDFRTLPIVAISGELVGIPRIGVDNASGIIEAVGHLRSVHHCQRLVFIAGPRTNPEAEARRAAFLKATADIKTIIYEGDFRFMSGEAAARIMLQASELPDAVLAANDEMAGGCYWELYRRGVDIRGRIALIGFDDLPESRYYRPPLSTIAQPFAEMGHQAVSMLVRLLAGATLPQLTLLPSRLIIRQSCGCHPQLPDPAPDRLDAARSDLSALEASLDQPHDESFPWSLHLWDALSTKTPHKNANPEWPRQGFALIDADYQRRESKARAEWRDLLRWLRKAISTMNATPDSSVWSLALIDLMRIMGMPPFCLSLFEPYNHGQSHVVLAYDSSGRMYTPDAGLQFPTRDLLPPGFNCHSSGATLAILPIFSHGEQYGFLAFALNPSIDAEIYEIIREQLSLAVRNIRVHTELTRIRDSLERANASLAASEKHYRDLAIHLPSLIIETDSKGRVVFLNETACKVFGLAVDQPVLGFSLSECVAADDRERFQSYCTRALGGELPGFSEFKLGKPEGSGATLLCEVQPIRRAQHISGLRFSAIDFQPFLTSVIEPDESFFHQYPLTARERAILLHILSGLKNKAIAAKMGLAESTVKNHAVAIYAALGVGSREELFELVQGFQTGHYGRDAFLLSALSRLLGAAKA